MTWPINRESLIPYYTAALQVLKVTGDSNAILADSHSVPGNRRVVIKAFGLSPPVRAPEHWASRLEKSDRIRVFTGTTATAFQSNYAKAVAVLAETGGQTLRIRARCFVLAGGSPLNAILLLGNEGPLHIDPNQQTALGRNLMEHPYVYGAGNIVFLPDFARMFSKSPHWFQNWLSLTPTADVLSSLGVRDFHVVLSKVESDSWSETEKTLAQNYVSVFGTPPVIFSTTIGMEPTPSPQCYVSEAPSTSSQPLQGRLQLNFRDQDFHLATAIDWLKSLDVYAWIEAPRPSIVAVGHLMGTTRMGIDGYPRVVDPNCKLLNCQNVFVVGSSVFPTVGFVNPHPHDYGIGPQACNAHR